MSVAQSSPPRSSFQRQPRTAAAPAEEEGREAGAADEGAAAPRALKKEAAADVDRLATLTQQMVDSVFSFGELGFQEVESSRYLTGILEQHGFTDHTRHLRHPDGVGRRVGQRQARHRAGLGHRRHPAGARRSRASPIAIRWSTARRGTAKATTPASR